MFELANFKNEEYTQYIVGSVCLGSHALRTYIVFSVCFVLGSQALRMRNIHFIYRLFGLARFKSENSFYCKMIIVTVYLAFALALKL